MNVPIPEDLQQEVAMLAGKILLEDRDTAIMSRVLTKLRDYAALEAQSRQLREALKRFISVATDAMPWQEHLDAAVVQARAALAATNEKEEK